MTNPSLRPLPSLRPPPLAWFVCLSASAMMAYPSLSLSLFLSPFLIPSALGLSFPTHRPNTFFLFIYFYTYQQLLPLHCSPLSIYYIYLIYLSKYLPVGPCLRVSCISYLPFYRVPSFINRAAGTGREGGRDAGVILLHTS